MEHIYSWLRRNGAVDYPMTKLRIAHTGQAKSTVRLRDIAATVEKSAPLTGTLVHFSTAGSAFATVLLINLDENEPGLGKSNNRASAATSWS